MHDERHADAPIGRVLWDRANQVSRIYDEHLAAAGGSRPIWFIMLALKKRPSASQREIAADVGIQGATLTHHLAAMEADGLLTRRRDPDNRRVHLIELTEEGETAFHRLRDTAIDFDRRLRSGIPEAEISQLRATLDKMLANVAHDHQRSNPS